jgi:hypothetical protein
MDERIGEAAKILQLGVGFWGSKTLLTAVELGVFSELAREPLDCEALRQRLGLHPRSARDFFDALCALGMLERDGGRYHNTPASDTFLDRAKPSYLGGFLEMANQRLYPFWGSLTEGLRSGQPQNEARAGEDFFAALYEDPEKLRQFLNAMGGGASFVGKAIIEKFSWKEYQTFVDVGGAKGNLAVQLAQAYDHLSGGSFDLPAVGPIFDEYVTSLGLDNRLKFYPGDFFRDPLPPADVLIMGHVLHDWSLDEKLTLIRKAQEALPEGGALLVYDAMIDDERRHNTFALLMSLNMLIETTGGFEYTPEDCRSWMREAGFKQTSTVPLMGPETLVVGIK